MVQAGSELMDNLAGNDRKPGREGSVLIGYPAIASAFFLCLSDNSIRLGIDREKCIDFGLEVLDVLFAAFNLCATSDPEVL
jgi:hypothetical protein